MRQRLLAAAAALVALGAATAAQTAYIALARKEASSDYGVDFPGCVTAGRTLDDARRMAHEALALHLEGMREDREPLPQPATLDAVMSAPANRDAVAFLVDVPAAPARSVRISVMLPENLLQRIDQATANRSRFLADAARAKLGDAA